MREFAASVVEVSTDEDGILVIHFDDEGGQYLQLQAPEADDPVEFEAGYGNVYVEIDDQLNSGFNCFSSAELRGDRFRIVFARDAELVRRIGEAIVTFVLDDSRCGELRDALKLAFRAFSGFRVAP